MARRTAEQIRTDRARADAEESRSRQTLHREGAGLRSKQRSSEPKPSGSSSGRSKLGGIRSRLPGHPPAALVASETVTLIAITAYGFLGPSGDGTGKLPDPRPIVAVLGFWSLLGLVGSIGNSLATGVAWVGWILTSTVLVTGARGKGLTLYVAKLAQLVTPSTSTAAPAGAPAGVTGPIK